MSRTKLAIIIFICLFVMNYGVIISLKIMVELVKICYYSTRRMFLGTLITFSDVPFWTFSFNIVSFLCMFCDALKARHGSFRIPELCLMIPVLLGGPLGTVIGMMVFRHKIKKFSFILMLFCVSFIYTCLVQNFILGEGFL